MIWLFVFCKLPTILLLGMRLSALHSFMFSQEEQYIKKIGAHRINHIEDIFMHDYNRVLGQLEDNIILSGDTVLMPTENSRKEFAN